MNHYNILVFLCALIIISYLFGIVSRKIKVPSVLLLILAGVLSKHLLTKFGLDIIIGPTSMQLIGTLGLILIVLEGSLDLNIKRGEVPIVINSLLFSVMMITILTITIGIIISIYYNQMIFISLINAVPMSIVSSAIVIPSVNMLSKRYQEFLICNSIFSDIFGVLIFNFLLFSDFTRHTYIIGFLASIVLTLALSILFSIILALMLSNFKQGNEIIVILALVILLYSIGKLFHISSLILVFTFGLILSNFHGINKKFDLVNCNINNMTNILKEFKEIIGQFSFIIRTLFFFIFGFSIEIEALWNNNTIFVGSICLVLVYFLRYILLRILFQTSSLAMILIAPRGLITILLFYAIPQKYVIKIFDEGNVLFLIILTNIIMIIGLLFSSKKTTIN